MRWPAITLFVLLSPLWCGASQQYPVRVFTSILPYKYFIEQVGGNFVDVGVMVGPGQSPATYEPSPKKMTQLSEAQAYFRIGMPFESVWMDRLSAINPKMRVIDINRGVSLRSMEPAAAASHSQHSTLKDPHTWTSPALVKIQARTIRDGLSELDPPHEDDYEANYRRLVEQLDRLDRDIREMLIGVRHRSFMVFHPVWGYFADAYGLRQISIEFEGKQPSAKQLRKLIERGRSEGINAIFLQPQFSRRSAETIAQAIGAKIIMVDPLSENYPQNMRRVAAVLAESMR